MSRDMRRIYNSVKAKVDSPTVGEIAHELMLPVGDVLFLAQQFGSGLVVVAACHRSAPRDLVIEIAPEEP